MPWRENKGVCQFRRILDGYFWGSLKARNLWGKSLMKYGLWPEIICNSGRQQIKSLTKILDQNALEFLASGKQFIMDRLRLEI